MKKILCVLLTLCCLLPCFAACASLKADGAPAGMKKMENGHVDFDLYIPNTWVEGYSTKVLTAYASETDMSNITVMAFELNEATATVDDYWAQNEVDMAATFTDIEYLSKGTNTLLDGLEAKKYNYRATVTGNPYEFLQVICVRAGTVYVFTYTAKADLYDSHYDEVEQMLTNFAFKK